MGIEIAACGEGNVVIGLEGGSYLNENKINGLVVEKVGSRFRSLRHTPFANPRRDPLRDLSSFGYLAKNVFAAYKSGRRSISLWVMAYRRCMVDYGLQRLDCFRSMGKRRVNLDVAT